MTLYIDGTDYNQVTYVVFANGKFKKKSYEVAIHKSYEVLANLEVFLKLAKYQISNIQYIVCNKGPGSYTGTRIAAAHALAISLALNIPVKFLESKQFIRDLKA